jgi:DNA invertase Pin-like site-specific DNA recombinase
LKEAGCEKVFEETICGAARERPELERLLGEVRKGDVLVVTRLDRLARSTAELLIIAERIQDQGADLQSLNDPGRMPSVLQDPWS